MKLVSAPHAGAPDVLSLTDAPEPRPGPGQVRIKVAYATLSPLDVLVRQGRVPWVADGWPFVPGLAFSGRVDAVGPDMDGAWIGQAVFSGSDFGGCAEYALAPANRIEKLRLDLGWKLATTWRTPTLAAALLCRDAARIERGETVLLHSAAGPLAIMIAQAARDLGVKIIGLAGGPAKCAFARTYGYASVLDYREPSWPQSVMQATGGHGCDLIVDGNGGPNAPHNYEVVAPNGRVFYVGATSGMAAPPLATPLLMARAFSVGGFNLNAFTDSRIAAIEPELVAKLASGAWKFPIGEIVPLSDVPRLHARFESRELMGRSLINIGGDM